MILILFILTVLSQSFGYSADEPSKVCNEILIQKTIKQFNQYNEEPIEFKTKLKSLQKEATIEEYLDYLNTSIDNFEIGDVNFITSIEIWNTLNIERKYLSETALAKKNEEIRQKLFSAKRSRLNMVVRFLLEDGTNSENQGCLQNIQFYSGDEKKFKEFLGICDKVFTELTTFIANHSTKLRKKPLVRDLKLAIFAIDSLKKFQSEVKVEGFFQQVRKLYREEILRNWNSDIEKEHPYNAKLTAYEAEVVSLRRSIVAKFIEFDQTIIEKISQFFVHDVLSFIADATKLKDSSEEINSKAEEMTKFLLHSDEEESEGILSFNDSITFYRVLYEQWKKDELERSSIFQKSGFDVKATSEFEDGKLLLSKIFGAYRIFEMSGELRRILFIEDQRWDRKAKKDIPMTRLGVQLDEGLKLTCRRAMTLVYRWIQLIASMNENELNKSETTRAVLDQAKKLNLQMKAWKIESINSGSLEEKSDLENRDIRIQELLRKDAMILSNPNAGFIFISENDVKSLKRYLRLMRRRDKFDERSLKLVEFAVSQGDKLDPKILYLLKEY